MIQDKLKNLGLYGCLLFCYGKILDVSEEKIINDYNSLVSSGIITKECYINNFEKLSLFWNKKRSIKIFTDFTNIKNGVYIGKFTYKENNHFCIVYYSDGAIDIEYNTLDNSQCIKYGKLKELRLVYEKK